MATFPASEDRAGRRQWAATRGDGTQPWGMGSRQRPAFI